MFQAAARPGCYGLGAPADSGLLKQVDSLPSERMSQLLTVVRGVTLLEPLSKSDTVLRSPGHQKKPVLKPPPRPHTLLAGPEAAAAWPGSRCVQRQRVLLLRSSRLPWGGPGTWRRQDTPVGEADLGPR